MSGSGIHFDYKIFDIWFPQLDYQTVLHLSSRLGHWKLTGLFCSEEIGGNVNARDLKNFTPLHYGCLGGHTKDTRILLDSGANVTLLNEYGDAPIHTAARYNRLKIIPHLLALKYVLIPRRMRPNIQTTPDTRRLNHRSLSSSSAERSRLGKIRTNRDSARSDRFPRNNRRRRMSSDSDDRDGTAAGVVDPDGEQAEHINLQNAVRKINSQK